MNIDHKNPMLKSNISQGQLSQKKMETGIDQNAVSGMAQKGLSGDLRDEKSKNKNLKTDSKKKQKQPEDEKTNLAKKISEDLKIVRDPLKLLKLF